MLFRVIENHPNCPLTYFRWVTLLFVHDPILSNDGVSSKPGAIQDLEGIRDRAGVSEAYAICVGMKRDEKLRELAPRICFREFRRFLQKDDYALFAGGKPHPSVLVRIDSSMSSAPGYSWHATHVARRFHADWAILLNYGDCEDSAGAAFPLVLGFARISNLRRSAGTVFLENRCARGGMPDYFGRYLPVGEGEEEPVLSP
jgi:hypothetical protein